MTGDPFTPPDESPNARHCPTLEEMEELVNSSNMTGNDLRRRLLGFMTSNETHLTTRFGSNSSSFARSYLRLIRALDFKKIRLDYLAGGTLRMEKLPRDTPFHGEPDGIVNQIRASRNYSNNGKFFL